VVLAVPARPSDGGDRPAVGRFGVARSRGRAASDRERGILDLLTAVGIQARFPAEADRRRWLGKFYYRPPGGESWADLALRIRSLLADLDRAEPGRRVLIVAQDAVILLFRYVCEGLSEDELLAIAKATTVTNASVTHLTTPSGQGFWKAAGFNMDQHLQEQSAPRTEHAGGADVLPHRSSRRCGDHPVRAKELVAAGGGGFQVRTGSGTGGRQTPGAAPDQAACWATHLHAAAGDRLTARVGAVGFLAGELVDELPIVLTELDV